MTALWLSRRTPSLPFTIPSTLSILRFLLQSNLKKVVKSPFYQSLTGLYYVACLSLSVPLSRILRKIKIQLVSKPFTKTLQNGFPSPQFMQPLDLPFKVVNKIPRSDCSWNYMGKPGDAFKIERGNAMKTCAKGSNMANHYWLNNNSIDFNSACISDKGNHRVSKTGILAHC